MDAILKKVSAGGKDLGVEEVLVALWTLQR
jgi:hypothetical protein